MIQIKLEGVEEALRAFDPKHVEKAAALGINDTVRQVRTATSQEIRKTWNVKAGDLAKKIKAVKMARNGDLNAIIEARSESFSLSYFGAKSFQGKLVQTRNMGRKLKRVSRKQGVFVTIKKGEAQTHIPQGFMAAVRAGKGDSYHIGVFERKGKDRLPIVERRVITLASMFAKPEVQKAAAEKVNEVWPRRFQHHLDRLAGFK